VKLKVEEASTAEIAEIDSFRYDSPYEFYNGNDDPVLNPERFFAARDEDGKLIGFFYFETKGDALEIGLGLRPDLTGHGFGLEFTRAGLAFGRERFRPRRIVLNVAEFNERAIKVYERAGFRQTGRHVRTFERWGDVPFIDMELDE
jgi:RimJ/RimL family protein N-acetyltransferase